MLKEAKKEAETIIKKTIQGSTPKISASEVSVIHSISAGTGLVHGLSTAQMNELLKFENNVVGVVQTLNTDSVGVIFLNNPDSLKAGSRVKRTHQVLDVPVGEELLGRVLNPLGEALDNGIPVVTEERYPIEQPAAPIMSRAPVETPLQTGLKAVDSFVPIGLGQRELILGDRQTGKTAIAVDAIINQKNTGVICIYCAIGQRAAGTAQVIEKLREKNVLENSVVIVASGDDMAGLQYIAPYAATAIGEYFMCKGKDVLVVYDDLTAHARAYRQVSLLLRTPPGREAFPGDIFYLHARLLERATHLRPDLGGGSLTALPIVSTEAGNISAYIPTNIISITDGQIYLSAQLFQKGIMPAIDTGRSVSRVGGDAQLPAYKTLVGPLKLFYSQFEELESFAKFGTQMDAETQQRLNRGRAIRKVMEQMQYDPMAVEDQIAVIFATNEGLLDDFPPENVTKAQEIIINAFHQKCSAIIADIVKKKKKLTPEQQSEMKQVFADALQILQ